MREEGGEVVAVVAEVRDFVPPAEEGPPGATSAASAGAGGKAVAGAVWLEAVAAAVRSAVTAQHGVAPAVVALIPAHTVRRGQ